MFIFNSMTHVTITIGFTVFVLLWISLKENPFRAAGTFVQELFTSKKFMLHFLAMIMILVFNKIELSIEQMMKARPSFTPFIYKFEGNFVYWVQHTFANDWLTYVLTFFYVVVFPALLIGSIGLYTRTKGHKLFYAVCYAMMINYTVAIPFYLFFPVTEVWAHASNVDFLIPQVFPTFEQEYRPLSGLDNCFPSLHTSISVTLAVIASHSSNAFWRRFSFASALIIVFSIFYLGIHWAADMAAGTILGLTASHLALRLSEAHSSVRLPVAGNLSGRTIGK